MVRRLGAALRFLWGTWAGVAALAVFAACWQFGHERYGDFILPAPLATIAVALDILGSEAGWRIAMETVWRAGHGFLLASLLGSLLGLVAGYSAATLRLARPLLTVALGVPPIAWIVLAMIWFGSTHGTVVTTTLIATAPLVFVGAAEGAATRDRRLDDMARAFGAGPFRRLTAIGLRQVAAHLFPALEMALATAFKVAIMAELLANSGGLGAALATARANLDIARALAWVLIGVAALILIEFAILRPLRAEFERWREVARPWGVKR